MYVYRLTVPIQWTIFFLGTTSHKVGAAAFLRSQMVCYAIFINNIEIWSWWQSCSTQFLPKIIRHWSNAVGKSCRDPHGKSGSWREASQKMRTCIFGHGPFWMGEAGTPRLFFVWPLQMLLHLSEPTEAISNLPTLMISRFLMIWWSFTTPTPKLLLLAIHRLPGPAQNRRKFQSIQLGFEQKGLNLEPVPWISSSEWPEWPEGAPGLEQAPSRGGSFYGCSLTKNIWGK